VASLREAGFLGDGPADVTARVFRITRVPGAAAPGSR
jgi:hypothetical protein